MGKRWQLNGTRRGGRLAIRPVSLLAPTLASFYVLHHYISTGISPVAVVRALLVAVGASLALWVVASALLRDRGKGTAVAAAATLGAIFWHNLAVLAIGGLVALAAFVGAVRLRGGIAWSRALPVGNRLSLVIVVALAISSTQNGGALARLPADVGDGLHLAEASASAPASDSGLPDIYLIMLEDHLRADVLARRFGVGSGAFEAGLAALGYDVAPRSRSNYTSTVLSLLTMFEMRHIDAIPELTGLLAGVGNRQPLLRALTESGEALSILRAHGYEIVAVGSGFEEVALRSADRFLDSDTLNEFETDLLHETAAGDLIEAIQPSFFGDQLRARVGSTFADIATLAREQVDHPRFVFVHVFAPHGPIIFGRNGQPVFASIRDRYDLPMPDGWAAFSQRYGDEIRYVDELTLEALRDLDAHARSPYVAIVMSEEGARLGLEPDSDEERAEAVSNLFAARVPEGDDPFGPAITPVNIFPILLNRYLGTSIQLQPDRNLISELNNPFHIVEIPNTDH